MLYSLLLYYFFIITMDKTIKDFVNHLFELGIINTSSVREVLSIYNKHKLLNSTTDNNINTMNNMNNSMSSFKTPYSQSGRSVDISNHINSINNLNYINPVICKDLQQTILYEFLTKQDSNSLNQMASDIVNKYSENNQLDKTKSAKKHFIYYLRFFKQKQIYYFTKWRRNIYKKWKIKEREVMTTSQIKEHNAILHCTFKPRINPKSASRVKTKNREETFNRLFNDYERYNTKKAIKKLQKDRKDSELLRNVPDVMSLSNNNMNTSYNTNNMNSNMQMTFFERQEEYSKSKLKRRENLVKETEEEESRVYTFTPNITSMNKLEINSPAHVRLYK